MDDQQQQDPGYRARAEAERDLAEAQRQAAADLDAANNPPKYKQTGDTYYDTASNFIKDLVKGVGSGALRTASELGKYTWNPATAGGLPAFSPFDVAIEQTQPTNTVQKIGSYIPDLALSLAGGGEAGNALIGPAKRWAGTSWADALKRPLAERIGGRDKLAEEILEKGFGRLTRSNASKAAELAAGKAAPGEREAAFDLMDQSYKTAKVPTGSGITARIFAPAGQAARAQGTMSVANTPGALPMTGTAAQLAAQALARLMQGR